MVIQMINHKWLKTRKVDGPFGMAPKRKSAEETAIVYVRMSSESNVGEGKHSDARQVDACTAYAKIAGLQILTTFRDPGVSGTDSLIARPGFSSAAEYCSNNKVPFVLIETGDRSVCIARFDGFRKHVCHHYPRKKP
jgi:predicted site-specific integrase-resolvase